MSDFGRAAIIFAAVAEVLYVLGMLTVRWWRTPVGRSRFVKATSLALAVSAIAFGRWIGIPGWAWDALATLLAAGATYQLTVFTRERLRRD